MLKNVKQLCVIDGHISSVKKAYKLHRIEGINYKPMDGFGVQRPVKRAYKQDQKQIDKWLNEEYICKALVYKMTEMF